MSGEKESGKDAIGDLNNEVIGEIINNSLFDGIRREDFQELVNKSKDLNELNASVTVLAHKNKIAQQEVKKEIIIGSPTGTRLSREDFDNNIRTHTDKQEKEVSKAMNVKVSELIKAVKELTGTPVCKRKKNDLNDRIVKFFDNYDRQVDKSTLRSALTRGVGDAQQMIDMWGKHVTDYAKSGKATCYLCGRKIYAYASCPEMEHKLPVTTAYSSMTHYRRLEGYYGDEDKTMFQLWKYFVDDNLNAPDLEKLYKLINEGKEYDEEEVDKLYDDIFERFWYLTKYSQSEDNEDYNILYEHYITLYNFFYYFIKGWLLEFAYSHHTCNQSKSDFYIYNNMLQFNKMTKGLMKREVQRTDAKVNVETRAFGVATNHRDAIINRRENMGLDMYTHFIETIDKYYKHSDQLNSIIRSEVNFTYPIEDGNTIEERRVMIKALYLALKKNSESNKGKKSGKKQGDSSKKQETQEDININTTYENLLRTESKILDIESKILYKESEISEGEITYHNYISQRKKNQTQDEINQLELELGQLKSELGQLKSELGQLKSELGQLKPVLEEQVTTLEESIEHFKNENDGEHPITCNFDCVASEEIAFAESVQLFSDIKEDKDNARGSSSYATDRLISPIQESSSYATDRLIIPIQESSSYATDMFSSPHQTGIKRANTGDTEYREDTEKIKEKHAFTKTAPQKKRVTTKDNKNKGRGQGLFSGGKKGKTKRKRRTKKKRVTKRKK